MIRLFALMLLSGVLAVGTAAEKPTVIVAKFHADWCGSCKAMGEVMSDLTNKLDGQPALFVTFDLTNQATTRRSALLASGLGLGDVFDQHGSGTGFLLVVDAQTRSVKGKLTREQSFKDMVATIQAQAKPN